MISNRTLILAALCLGLLCLAGCGRKETGTADLMCQHRSTR